MTQWNPEIENLTRALGKDVDKYMTDLVNPKSSVLGSGLRTAFRSVTKIGPKTDKICKKAGFEITDWQSDMQKIIDLAEQNGSDAADNIKKWLPASKDIATKYDPSLKGVARQIRYAKHKYGPK